MSEYNPDEYEPKWQKYWEENQIFKTDTLPEDSGLSLHQIASGIYSRFKRLRGSSARHDAFGLQHPMAADEHSDNVINPDEVIDEYGVDTFRLCLMFMGPLDAPHACDPKAITGISRFLKRVWNLYDGHARRGCAEKDSDSVLRELHRLIKQVTEDTEKLRLNTSISAFMRFLNATSMDSLSKQTLSTFAILLSPYACHLAEEVWAMLGNAPSVAKQEWPSYDPVYLQGDTVKVVIQVNGKKRGTLDVAADAGEDAVRDEVRKILSGTAYALAGKERIIAVYHQETKTPRLINVVK